MAYLAAHAATHTAVLHMRHRVLSQGVGVRTDRERRASRQPDAAMVAGACVRVDAEAFAHHPLGFHYETAYNGFVN